MQGVKNTQWTLTANPQSALQEFVDKLHEANQGEVKFAELAQNKAQNPQVKEFAQQLLREHRNADMKLSEFAKGKNMAFGGRTNRSSIGCATSPASR